MEKQKLSINHLKPTKAPSIKNGSVLPCRAHKSCSEQKKELQEQVKLLSEANARLQEENRKLTEENNRVNDLKIDLTKILIEIEKLQGHSPIDHYSTAATLKISELQMKLALAQEREKQLNESEGNAKTQIAYLQLKMCNAEDARDRSLNKLGYLESEKYKLELQLKALAKEDETCTRKIEIVAVQRKLEEVGKEVSTIKEAIDVENENVSLFNVKYEKILSDLDNIQNAKIQKLEITIQKFEEEKTFLEKKLIEIENQKTAAEKALKEKPDSNSALETKRRIQELEAQIQRFEVENASFQQKMNEKEDQTNFLKERLNDAEAKIYQLTVEEDADMALYQAKNLTFQQKCAEMEEENRTTKKALNDAQETISHLTSENQDLENKIRKFTFKRNPFK